MKRAIVVVGVNIFPKNISIYQLCWMHVPTVPSTAVTLKVNSSTYLWMGKFTSTLCAFTSFHHHLALFWMLIPTSISKSTFPI